MAQTSAAAHPLLRRCLASLAATALTLTGAVAATGPAQAAPERIATTESTQLIAMPEDT